MNPLRLTARNYRTFELLDYQPALGATVITGENGAGKSSIVNLIDVALFAGRGELAPLVTLGEQELELLLEFEHAGTDYRVRRCYRNGKTTVDLEELRAVGVAPLTRETTEATQTEVERILGLTRTTFRASAFLRQGDGAAFTEAQPRDRKAILAEILNLAAYNQLLACARDDIHATQRDVDITAAKITERETLADVRFQLHGQLTVLETIEREATKDLAKAETEHERALAALAAVEAATERVRACAAERDAVQQQVDRARAELQRVGSAAVALPAQSLARDKAITEAARVPVLEQQLDDARRANLELAAATRERAALLQQADRLNDEVVRLDREAGQLAGRAMELHAKADELAQHDDGRVCEACGQPLSTAEARAQVIVGWREQAEALMADSVAKSNDSTELEAQQSELRELAAAVTVPEARDTTAVERDLAAARDAAGRLPDLEHALKTSRALLEQEPDLRTGFLEAAAELDVRQAAYDEAVAAVGDRAALERDVDTARRWVLQERERLDRAKTEHARVWVRLDQIDTGLAELDELRAASVELHVRLDLLKLAERAFSPNGIPALIVENAAIPQIETEANRILDELGTSYRVELRTQRALKTSETLKETLDILIHTDAGERPYETFSGGERTRLNLALRIALARLLAHRRGADSRLLVIDEPDHLDPAGYTRLAGVLHGLRDDFEKVLVVSHHPDLRDAFDQVLEVVKDGGRSRVVGAVSEAVAA